MFKSCFSFCSSFFPSCFFYFLFFLLFCFLRSLFFFLLPFLLPHLPLFFLLFLPENEVQFTCKRMTFGGTSGRRVFQLYSQESWEIEHLAILYLLTEDTTSLLNYLSLESFHTPTTTKHSAYRCHST